MNWPMIAVFAFAFLLTLAEVVYYHRYGKKINISFFRMSWIVLNITYYRLLYRVKRIAVKVHGH